MKTYLELYEIDLIEEAVGCLRDRLLIRLLSRLGCRISELLAIKAGDVDFEQKTITILHLKRTQKFFCSHCNSRLANRHRFCPLCGNKISESKWNLQEKRRIRVLPIDESTISIIREYLKTLSVYDDIRPLFPISRHRAWQIVRDCAREAGLPALLNPETGRVRGISPHCLRDAFSVRAMKVGDSGDGLRLLQEHLGHLSFNTTAMYRKIADEEHRQWYDNLWNNQSS